MAIDRAQVRKVARLARLALTEAEEETFAAQLSHVLDYIETLEGAGFKFNNPNVKSTCGCGSSFSV